MKEHGLQPQARHQVLAEAVVKIYCDWLNQYMTHEDDPVYTPDNFNTMAPVPSGDVTELGLAAERHRHRTVANTERNQRSGTTIDFIREETNDDRIYMEVDVDDGEGGPPTTLYVYALRDWHYLDPGLPACKYVQDDTYTIGFILQEFDTQFSPVYQGDPKHLFNNYAIADKAGSLIERLKARVEAAEGALVDLTNTHHHTVAPSRKHDARYRGWADCSCLTCKRTADLCPEQAEAWRRCECRARYSPDVDGTLPAVAMCSHAAECAQRIAAEGKSS